MSDIEIASSIRVRKANDAQLRTDGKYVLYWMIAARRTRWNFAFERAVEWAKELGQPLIVFEPLRVGYLWASNRLHQFVIEGMLDNRESLAGTPVAYYPYVEPQPDADKGLLAALAAQASVVITDEFPAFFLPRMVTAAAKHLDVRVELVDSNGLWPLHATGQVFTSAYQFRRFLQKNLPPHLETFPKSHPLTRTELPPASLPRSITSKWPAAKLESLLSEGGLAELPIDHRVGPAALRGGQAAASRTLKRFLERNLSHYGDDRNDPEADVASGLSPYLHFGHISTHEVFRKIAELEDWGPKKLAAKATGKREGWWGMSPAAESFLDELITWRELGYNMCSHQNDYDRYESLPDWARVTLEKHARDKRSHIYTLRQLENAETYDELWNAAQRQLVREGRMHNYLRMLWGKKILEWTPSPREALAVMIELNNKYAVDGRDPNSYSGIFWCLGRYDRPWGPERKIFGKIRYMSSDNTARKLRVTSYLKKYSR
jgi:deoxyribodipyrimidine photo-lyase